MARGRGGSGGGGGSGDGFTSEDLAWDADPLLKAHMIVQLIFAVFTLVQLIWLVVLFTKKRIAPSYKAPFGLLTLSMVLLILGYALDGVAVRYRDVVSFDWNGEPRKTKTFLNQLADSITGHIYSLPCYLGYRASPDFPGRGTYSRDRPPSFGEPCRCIILWKIDTLYR
jgi:hypothetical protein